MNANPNATYRQHQLRKVAILVATLGEPLAEQLLADLPEQDAIEVRELVVTLDEIDAQEYEAVFADFRQSSAPAAEPVTTRASTNLTGVELDASLLARIEAADDRVDDSLTTTEQTRWQAISEAGVDTLIEMLSAEQPQTIAVVLARLEAAQAAELITRLPTPLQSEVISRLSALDPADEQALQVVEAQLAEWIDAKRRQQQRVTAGHELVQQILDNTPAQQRATLLTQLGRKDPELASQLISGTRVSCSTKSVRFSAKQSPVSQIDVATTVKRNTPAESTAVATNSDDPLGELEALDDQAILRAMQTVERQTVMLALAGASDSFIKRIVKGLPRRQANQFRQQVRAIGPTRLSDMLAAQRELVRSSRA